MHKIMIVDDDAVFREALSSQLNSDGYETAAFDCALKALDEISGDIKAIISDIKMPKMSGLELLKETKSRFPDIRFILMTGFIDLFDTREAFSLGADEFLTKPFEAAEITRSIDKALSEDKQTDVCIDEDYCSISMDEILSGKSLPSDIYLRLSGGKKYVKVAGKDNCVDMGRVQIYKNKGLTHLFVNNRDIEKYLGLNIKLSRYFATNSSVSYKKRLKAIKQALESALENAYITGLDRDQFEIIKNIVLTTVSVAGQDEKALELLEQMNNRNDHQFNHNVGVSMYSSLIARQMGWRTQATLFRISLAGLYQDFDLTSSEIFKVALHQVKNQGCPSARDQKGIGSISPIVSIADTFCKYALKSFERSGENPKQILHRMLQESRNMPTKKPLIALSQIFDVSYDEI